MATITKAGRELANKLSGPENGLVSPSVCSLLHRHAISYHHIQESLCNDSSPVQQAWCNKREKELEKRIVELAYTVPGVVNVTFSGDPRGYCVHLHFKDYRYNTWGGVEEGYGI